MPAYPPAIRFAAGAVLLAAGGAQAEVPAVDESAPIDPALGIRLPQGLTASIFADEVGRVRHIAVTENGTLYARLREPAEGGGALSLQREFLTLSALSHPSLARAYDYGWVEEVDGASPDLSAAAS